MKINTFLLGSQCKAFTFGNAFGCYQVAAAFYLCVIAYIGVGKLQFIIENYCGC